MKILMLLADALASVLIAGEIMVWSALDPPKHKTKKCKRGPWDGVQ